MRGQGRAAVGARARSELLRGQGEPGLLVETFSISHASSSLSEEKKENNYLILELRIPRGDSTFNEGLEGASWL